AIVSRIARNQIFLVAKHYPASLLRRYWWPILVGQALWGMLALRHGAGWAFVRGKMDGWRHCGSMRRAADGDRLARILRDGERQIRQAHRGSESDWYWRVYFLLTSSGTD